VNNMVLRGGGGLERMERWIQPLELFLIMMKSILRVGAVGLLAAAMAGMPARVLAQSTNRAAAEKKATVPKKEAAEKKKSPHPFHGKLAGVDKTAKTILVGKSVYQITSGTKITKGGKPATLEEGVVGEIVTGYVKPTEDGKMAATTVRFGPKPEDKGAESKPEAKGSEKKKGK
jgi:hypothetical protein